MRTLAKNMNCQITEEEYSRQQNKKQIKMSNPTFMHKYKYKPK